MKSTQWWVWGFDQLDTYYIIFCTQPYAHMKLYLLSLKTWWPGRGLWFVFFVHILFSGGALACRELLRVWGELGRVNGKGLKYWVVFWLRVIFYLNCANFVGGVLFDELFSICDDGGSLCEKDDWDEEEVDEIELLTLFSYLNTYYL